MKTCDDFLIPFHHNLTFLVFEEDNSHKGSAIPFSRPKKAGNVTVICRNHTMPGWEWLEWENERRDRDKLQARTVWCSATKSCWGYRRENLGRLRLCGNSRRDCRTLHYFLLFKLWRGLKTGKLKLSIMVLFASRVHILVCMFK